LEVNPDQTDSADNRPETFGSAIALFISFLLVKGDDHTLTFLLTLRPHRVTEEYSNLKWFGRTQERIQHV